MSAPLLDSIASKNGKRPFFIIELTTVLQSQSGGPGFMRHVRTDLSGGYPRRFDGQLCEGALNQSVAALGGIR